MLANRIRLERVPVLLEPGNRIRQARSIGFLKVYAGRRVFGSGRRYHGLQSAAVSVGDHRTPAGLRLKRHKAEIILARRDQRTAARVVIAQNLVRLPAQEPYILRRSLARPGRILAIADHHKLAVELTERLQRKVNPLVRRQCADP